MTNFEIITQKPFLLAEFLEMVVDDALEAEGCSLNLTMPTPEWAGRSWRDWLEQEATENGEVCETIRGSFERIGLPSAMFGGPGSG